MKRGCCYVIAFFFMYVCTCEAVHLSISTDLTATGTWIEIPIHISESNNINAGGFSLRLDYDNTVLFNPEVITEGTLTEGKSFFTKVPDDEYGGKFAVGVMMNLGQLTDTILVKIRLHPKEIFHYSPISLVAEKTNFHDPSLYPIETTVSKKLVMVQTAEGLQVKSVLCDYNNDGLLNIQDVLVIMKNLFGVGPN
ncbi:MAG: hypothetical protein OMM_05688 [Candidatus Magnetoglobus multicellularis str. Araruama]|uniref:Cohesin domain-containing protein n=1 Tax=Candidatus Magnetoglobus multicellularis str. Araruama TaxID=890399 RepID=A0A1V1NUV5_9BACT|nr:MAG: hypothetical protein OMM_05688 [Candidatus Magnetoglobus multicellularis str. Araruama]